jgi:integrase
MAARQMDQGKTLWSRSLGHRGTRVRIFEKRKNGMLYRATWITEPGSIRGRRSIASLGTYDRNEAICLGKALLAELLRGNVPARGPVTLGDLCERFQSENGDQLNNKPRSRADDAARARVLIAYFGSGFEVRQLTALHCHQFAQSRRRGGIKLATADLTSPSRQRTVDADLGLLRRMLAWACTVPIGVNGQRWLDRDPLAGVRREHEKNPRRPVATWERFTGTRIAIQRLTGEARQKADEAAQALFSAAEKDRRRLRWDVRRNEAAVTRWIKVEMALVLAEATGRRLGSIAALRWDDIDFNRKRITWRAESDKRGVQWVVPLPDSLANELRQFQKQLVAVGGLVFASENDATVQMHRKQFDKWLRVAEATAGLPSLKGGLWHPYRRKFASERMHLPLKAVSEAGGWKSTTTLLTCYQHPDEALLAQVMSEPRKLHDSVAVGA